MQKIIKIVYNGVIRATGVLPHWGVSPHSTQYWIMVKQTSWRRTLDTWGMGDGLARRNMKTSLSPQKSEYMGKKRFVDGIDGNVDQTKHVRSSTKHTNIYLQKFSYRSEKNATNKNSSPPHISNIYLLTRKHSFGMHIKRAAYEAGHVSGQ